MLSASQILLSYCILKSNNKLFTGQISFIKGIKSFQDIPEGDFIEICFSGRSNVGKSSLINFLTGRKSIARTSKTPGRTREINFFRSISIFPNKTHLSSYHHTTKIIQGSLLSWLLYYKVLPIQIIYLFHLLHWQKKRTRQRDDNHEKRLRWYETKGIRD